MSVRLTRSISSTGCATKELFLGRSSERGDNARKWAFNQSSLFLDFLAGNQTYHCTPWGNPTRNVFGWQRPCYLLGEGYAKSFRELMEETDWERLRRRQLCEMRRLHGAQRLRGDGGPADFRQTALEGARRGELPPVRTEGPMAPGILLEGQRPADFVFERGVQEKLSEMRRAEAEEKAGKKAATAV